MAVGLSFILLNRGNDGEKDKDGEKADIGKKEANYCKDTPSSKNATSLAALELAEKHDLRYEDFDISSAPCQDVGGVGSLKTRLALREARLR
jgi:hypothetical protein